MCVENPCTLSNPQRNAQSSLEHAASVLRVVLAWKRSVRVLCSSAVDEPSSSADALQHCLQNFVGVRPSVLCSSARAGASIAASVPARACSAAELALQREAQVRDHSYLTFALELAAACSAAARVADPSQT